MHFLVVNEYICKNYYMKKLLASPLGTALKAFIVTILTLLLSTDDLFSMDAEMAKKLITAGLLSAFPVIINWLNPSYPGYGQNKENV